MFCNRDTFTFHCQSAALVRTVACLLVVQRVRGSKARMSKILNFWTRRDISVQLLIANVHHRPALKSKSFRRTVHMLGRHVILLIAIHQSDGDFLRLGVTLVLIDRRRLCDGTSFTLSLPFNIILPTTPYIKKTIIGHTGALKSLTFSTVIQIHIPHVA